MSSVDKDAKELIEKTEKKILEAFKVFDHDNNDTIEVKEVGTVIRSLGLIPSQAEVEDIIMECKDIENPDDPNRNSNFGRNNSDQDVAEPEVIRKEKFVPVMLLIMTNNKMQPYSEEKLLQAFQVLDSNQRGFLTEDEIHRYMTQDGEPFNSEEIAEMLETALDEEDRKLYYKSYLNQLIIETE